MSQRQEKQEELLELAISHGPYKWSTRDVENALLWFHPLSPVGSKVTNELDKGCEFLRRLLTCPGGSVSRHRLPSATKPRSARKRKRSSVSGAESHDRYGSSDEYGTHLSRTKGGPGDRESGVKESRLNEAQSPPLQSVLMGYYHLFLASSSANSCRSSTVKNKDTEMGDEEVFNNYHFTAADIKQAETASSKLLADLNSIISARRHTNNIYQSFLNVATRENNSDGQGLEARTGNPRGHLSFLTRIDGYMTHPTTCSRRVYASSLFNRLLNPCNPMWNESDYPATLDSAGANPATQRLLLKKLIRLATANVKIQEVVLLLLLEPVRRLQCSLEQQLQTSHDVNSQKSPSLPDEDFPPLPLSTSIWSNVSSESIEKACTIYPIRVLVQSILNSCPRSALHAVTSDTSHANITSSILAPDDFTGHLIDSFQIILWWTLPSPLLCTISQIYFQIACKYIQYWIERAVIGHEKLYEGSPTGCDFHNGKVRDIGIVSNRNNYSIEEPFFHAVHRIEQFSSTSARLNFLCKQSLQSMEKETISVSSNEDANSAAFKRSLAWKAIHRELGKYISP